MISARKDETRRGNLARGANGEKTKEKSPGLGPGSGGRLGPERLSIHTRRSSSSYLGRRTDALGVCGCGLCVMLSFIRWADLWSKLRFCDGLGLGIGDCGISDSLHFCNC